LDPIVEIPPFRLDRERGLLLHGSREIGLRRRTWEVLLHLVEHAGRVVTKQDLLRSVWSDAVVGEQTLSTSISELRKALGDDARTPRFIETVHGRGFRFLVTSARRAALDARDEASRDTGRAGFVGRAAPLASLMDAFARAARGRRELVLVSGETGVGKSALVEAFATGLPATLGDEQGVAIRVVKIAGQCVEFTGPGEAFMPFIAALRLLTRGPEARQAIATIRRLVPRWMAQILGADEATARADDDPGRESRTRTLRLLVETVEEIARDALLLVVIEDLQWSDPSTLELLDLLARRPDPARLLVVGTLRTDDTATRAEGLALRLGDLARKGLARSIVLPGLDAPEIHRFVESRMAVGAVHPELVARMQRWTDGNPFLLDELLTQLRREGRVVERDGEGRLDGDAVRDVESTPPSVREAVEARLAPLSTGERAAVEAAAVFGLAFDLEAIVAASASDDEGLGLEAVERLFQRLRSGGMIVGPMDEGAAEAGAPTAGVGVYGFRHALFAQAVRLAIPPARRRRIHRSLGEWCERSAGLAASVGAYHFEQSGDSGRALHRYAEAGRAAKRRQSDPEAIALFRAALRCLESLPASESRDELEMTLLVELGGSVLGVSGYTDPEVVPLYLRVRELASRLGRPVTNMVATGGLFFFSMSSGRIQDGHAEASRLMSESRSLPLVFDDIARSAMGVATFCLGRLADASVLLEREPGHAAPDAVAFDVHVPVLRLGALATAQAHQGDLRRARATIDETLAVGRSTGRAYDLANAHRLAAEYGASIGDAVLTREHAEATTSIADEFGFGQLGSIGRLFVAWADARPGDTTDSLAAIAASIDDLDRRGYRLMRSHFCARWAEVALVASRTDLALRVVGAGLDYVDQSGEVRHASELWRLRAAALRQAGAEPGDVDAATALDEALRLARDQGAHLFTLRGLVERALWTGPGREAARRTLRDFVLDAGPELAGADLARAREVLAH